MTTATTATAPGRTSEAQSFWASYFNFYDVLNDAAPYRDMIKGHVALLDPQEGDIVLDAGTGTGNVAVELSKTNIKLTGIDFVESALDMCRTKVPQAEFRFGDLSKPLEFADGHFDRVACCVVLQFMKQASAEHAVREFFRVLKPGGRATITVFIKGFQRRHVLQETLSRIFSDQGVMGVAGFVVRRLAVISRVMAYVAELKRKQDTGEHTFYSEREFEALVTQGGFKVLKSVRTFANQGITILAEKPAPAS